jgi:transposase-like protein
LLPADQLQAALKGLDRDQITGPGGLLSQLAGRVVNAALEGELTDYLGYPPGQAPPVAAQATIAPGRPPRRSRLSWDRSTVKTPRDRHGTFDPQLVAKRQTRLAGLDEKILGLYVAGLSVRDISVI